MVFGIGTDIIEISRIEKAIQEEMFNMRVFTEKELKESNRKAHRLAGFFAAKEAMLKAMGTGLAGFSWQEIEISHNEKGAPILLFHDKVISFLQEQKISAVHLSISHCREYAVASVILESETI